MIKKIYRKLRSISKQVFEKSHKEVFAEIYKNKTWGNVENTAFYSGTGSDDDYSLPYAEIIINFINEHKVTSVVDLGCGDFRVGSKINRDTDILYTGVDVVPELV